MADEPVVQNEEPAVEEPEAPEEAVEEIAAKAENPDAVSRALKAERERARKAKKELEAERAKVRDYEDRDKTEQQKLADEIARLKTFEEENLRLRVAMEKQIPAELVDRLKGKDREELEADADTLLALVARTSEAQAPRGSADQGARQQGENQLSRDALKNMSPSQIVQAQSEGRLDKVLGRG